MFNFILPFDLKIATAVSSLRSSCGKILTPILKLITISGNMGAIFIICAVAMLFFKKTRKIGVVILGALIFGVLLTNIFLKNVIARERPFSDESSQFYEFWKMAGSLNESGYSFPSGHTTASMAFGFSLFLNVNKKYSWLFLLIPILMGFTRIYFVVHFASDVVGGLIVGAIASVISHFVIKALCKNEKIKNLLCQQ